MTETSFITENRDKIDLVSWRRTYHQFFTEYDLGTPNLQDVFTPWDLCRDIIGKLGEYTSLQDKTFLVFNLEFAEVLMYNFNVPAKNISFISDNKGKLVYALKIAEERYSGIELLPLNVTDDNDWRMIMNRKFDVVIMNPPYQTKSDKSKTKKNTQQLWHKFVECADHIVEQGGIIAAIHPSGWRNIRGAYSKVKNILQSKKMHYLSIHNANDGMRTFGCATRYDWYILENNKTDPSYKTEIFCEDGNIVKIPICELPFIPNFDSKVFDLVAKGEEKRVDLLFDYKYEPRTRLKDGTMQKEPTDKFCYPCIQHVSVKGEPSCIWYSSLNSRGHFGIPKVIFPSQTGGTIIDEDGKFGMCQYCAAIVAPKKDLKYIKEAMDSKKFIDLMKACDFGGGGDRYPRKIIETFREDFWKEFI